MQADNNAVNAPEATPNVSTPPSDPNIVLDYNHSPHKGINPAEATLAKEPLLFGKYKTQEDAFKGYQNAEAKIREQGTELNQLKEQYKPMEDYSEESWTKRIDTWKADKSVPGDLSYDPSIPEINMLLKGFEKAGVSEKQAKDILAGAVERQMAIVAEREEAVKKELGQEGMKKVQALNAFASKLSGEDATAFAALFAFPHVEVSQVDLMYRLLCGQSEKQIPTGGTATNATKSSVDIYKEIMDFTAANKGTIDMNPQLQQKHAAMWTQYSDAKKRGF